MIRTLRLACMFALLLAAGGCAVSAQQDQPAYDDEVNVLSFEDLQYPVIPLDARIEGVVVVAVTFDAQGNVTSAAALSGNKMLIPECLSNAKMWKFATNPHRRAVIVYDFQASGTCRGNTRSLFRLMHKNFAAITGCVRPI